jgi:ketosteroid isomerase-like protein
MNGITKAGVVVAAAAAGVVAGAGGFAGLLGKAPDGNAVRAAIEAGNRKFSDGAARHDATVIAAAYSEDAEAFPPNADIVKGRPALEKLWQSVLDSGIAGIELKTTEVESAGRIAYETGTYAMKAKDGTIADRGKYCVVWKRVNGEWLLHRDIWSTSLPETKQ